MLTIPEYARKAATTMRCPKDYALVYLRYGFDSEVGEVASLFKREIRDAATFLPSQYMAELGDVLWYLIRFMDETEQFYMLCGFPVELWEHCDYSGQGELRDLRYRKMKDWGLNVPANAFREWVGLCHSLKLVPAEVAQANLDKLEDRARRGVIHGKGDNR